MPLCKHDKTSEYKIGLEQLDQETLIDDSSSSKGREEINLLDMSQVDETNNVEEKIESLDDSIDKNSILATVDACDYDVDEQGTLKFESLELSNNKNVYFVIHDKDDDLKLKIS